MSDLPNLILKVLKESGLNQEVADQRFLSTFIELQGKSLFWTTEELRHWVDELRESETMQVNRIPISELRRWKTRSTGEIYHDSGGFYEIVGVRVENANREVGSWDQPLVFQQEMGILGIVTAVHSGLRYYLLQAKAEPGNVGLIQLSPTLQATYANMKRLHEGSAPPFASLFLENSGAKVLYKKWLAEDGGRFLGKKNLNMLIEVAPESISQTLPNNFRWVTLRQIKELLEFDNYIGPHVRSIVAHL